MLYAFVILNFNSYYLFSNHKNAKQAKVSHRWFSAPRKTIRRNQHNFCWDVFRTSCWHKTDEMWPKQWCIHTCITSRQRRISNSHVEPAYQRRWGNCYQVLCVHVFAGAFASLWDFLCFNFIAMRYLSCSHPLYCRNTMTRYRKSYPAGMVRGPIGNNFGWPRFPLNLHQGL